MAAYLLLLGWIVILASLGIPTTLARLLECKCKEICKEGENISETTCLDLTTLGKTFFYMC